MWWGISQNTGLDLGSSSSSTFSTQLQLPSLVWMGWGCSAWDLWSGNTGVVFKNTKRPYEYKSVRCVLQTPHTSLEDFQPQKWNKRQRTNNAARLTELNFFSFPFTLWFHWKALMLRSCIFEICIYTDTHISSIGKRVHTELGMEVCLYV